MSLRLFRMFKEAAGQLSHPLVILLFPLMARRRLQWAGHVERMADDRLPKRAAELREQGRRRRGRLRWEDCVKRDVKKAGEEGDWENKTGERGGWKRLSDEAVKRCRKHLTPDKWKTRKRESCSLYLLICRAIPSLILSRLCVILVEYKSLALIILEVGLFTRGLPGLWQKVQFLGERQMRGRDILGFILRVSLIHCDITRTHRHMF